MDKKKGDNVDEELFTEYLLKENSDPENTSLIVSKRISPPFVARNPEFPPNSEGEMIEYIQKAFDPQDAENFREKVGDVTLEQLGRVAEVTEGEIRDVIEEIANAKVVAK